MAEAMWGVFLPARPNLGLSEAFLELGGKRIHWMAKCPQASCDLAQHQTRNNGRYKVPYILSSKTRNKELYSSRYFMVRGTGNKRGYRRAYLL